MRFYETLHSKQTCLAIYDLLRSGFITLGMAVFLISCPDAASGYGLIPVAMAGSCKGRGCLVQSSMPANRGCHFTASDARQGDASYERYERDVR